MTSKRTERKPETTVRPGRLSLPPHPVLFELLYEPQLREDVREVLPHLLDLDAAHVLMLARQKLLPAKTAAEILKVNQSLRGEPLPAPPEHRGMYLLYERQYVERLGEEGGAAHLARSRNDINSAVTRMRLRGELRAVLGSYVELCEATARQASAHAETLTCAFTHMQPAQPSSFGHYLAAVLSELVRAAEWLAATYGRVNLSPMGAAAGFGTSFPVDRELVADLCGFDGVIENSLDAVASRDYVVQVLAALAAFGTTLTRLATDLQLWSSHAYGFLGWPDELVSTSSVMPQKRNAYVLENIRGRAAQPFGALTNALACLKAAPFSNSVEVSSEATSHLWPAIKSSRTAARLAALLVENVEADRARMSEFVRRAGATMTALADHLVARHGLAFRAAHGLVAELVGRLPAGREPSPAELRRELEVVASARAGLKLELDERELARVLDADACMRAASHGGGPAPAATRAQLAELSPRLLALRSQLDSWGRRLDGSRDRLKGAVERVIQSTDRP